MHHNVMQENMQAVGISYACFARLGVGTQRTATRATLVGEFRLLLIVL